MLARPPPPDAGAASGFFVAAIGAAGGGKKAGGGGAGGGGAGGGGAGAGAGGGARSCRKKVVGGGGGGGFLAAPSSSFTISASSRSFCAAALGSAYAYARAPSVPSTVTSPRRLRRDVFFSVAAVFAVFGAAFFAGALDAAAFCFGPLRRGAAAFLEGGLAGAAGDGGEPSPSLSKASGATTAAMIVAPTSALRLPTPSASAASEAAPAASGAESPSGFLPPPPRGGRAAHTGGAERASRGRATSGAEVRSP